MSVAELYRAYLAGAAPSEVADRAGDAESAHVVEAYQRGIAAGADDARAEVLGNWLATVCAGAAMLTAL